MKVQYWKWKSTIIDFSRIPEEYPYGRNNLSAKDYIFMHLPLPNEETHRWYKGGWSSEYNAALYFAEKYGLIEVIDEVEE